MISATWLTGSTPWTGNAEALRHRQNDDGPVFLRRAADLEPIGWAHGKYRGALAGEAVIDLANEALEWRSLHESSRM